MAKKKEKGAAPKPPPKCKAILLCNQVILDRFTNTTSIIGLIDQFNLRAFPANIRPMTAFLQLTSGIGKYGLVVEIHDLQRDVIVGRGMDMAVDFPDRLTKVNVIIGIPPLPMNHEGLCDVVVKADGQEIDRQQFAAKLIQPPSLPADEKEEKSQ
jgi:hypothetical protein